MAVPLWAVGFYASGIIPDYSYAVFGIPAKTFVFAATVILPILLLLFVFLTGAWRLTAVLFGSLLLALFVFSNSIDDPVYIPEKNRSIAFDVNRVLPEGTEVFCNDVSLGTVPFQIKVTDLMEKVPPQTTPPEQRWSKSENPQLRYAAENSLQRLKLRIYLNENRRRLFDELVSGKITPDEILPGTKPFVWDGKKYEAGNTAD